MNKFLKTFLIMASIIILWLIFLYIQSIADSKSLKLSSQGEMCGGAVNVMCEEGLYCAAQYKGLPSNSIGTCTKAQEKIIENTEVSSPAVATTPDMRIIGNASIKYTIETNVKIAEILVSDAGEPGQVEYFIDDNEGELLNLRSGGHQFMMKDINGYLYEVEPAFYELQPGENRISFTAEPYNIEIID